MIFGIPVGGPLIVLGGVVLFLLVLVQTLVGLRVIKLGKRHRVIHRWTAYAIIGVAAVHGLLGIAFATGARIL